MWPGFDGKPYTRDEWTAHVAAIPRERLAWSKFITIHATSAPTLAQWAESGPAHDARIRNLESYYEHEKGWHAGPHAFVSRSYINGFSDLTRPGVHASCFNSRSIGIEMVGEFDSEDFNSGDGAKVAEMAVHAAAVLHRHIGIRPDGYAYSQSGLHFHIECRHDNHDCPGKTARDKPKLVQRILARMAELDGGAVNIPLPVAPRVPIAAHGIFSGIWATEFGGGRESGMSSAYGGVVHSDRPEVSLPARLPADRRSVRVFLGEKSVLCRVNDVGPWNINDAYWERPDGRPLAEQQREHRIIAQNRRVPTNRAGIDMTGAVFEALGIGGRAGTRSATIDWQFE